MACQCSIGRYRMRMARCATVPASISVFSSFNLSHKCPATPHRGNRPRDREKGGRKSGGRNVHGLLVVEQSGTGKFTEADRLARLPFWGSPFRLVISRQSVNRRVLETIKESVGFGIFPFRVFARLIVQA